MAYIKDTGAPGANNAELPTGAVLDTGAKTLSLEVDTDVQSAVVLEEKQWIVLETRNINGTANLIGECIYTEDATDLSNVLTFINDVRTRMIALHTTFNITATHYKTGSVIDIYRGDEATAATLEAEDTGVTFTIPALWSIDDLTPFAPDVATDENIIVDSGFDDPSKWSENANFSITGSKLEFNGNARAYPDLTEALVEGAVYDLSVNCDALSLGYFRFFFGETDPSYLTAETGDYTVQMTCPVGATTISLQGTNDLVGTFDNFTCKRI